MEPYVNDEHQAEAVKEWLRDNGGAIAVGVILGLAGIFGWQYWQRYQATQAEQASTDYQILVKAIEAGDRDQARRQGEALLGGYPKSAYAALGALQLARLAVESNDYAKAAEHLRWAVANAGLEETRIIARLRLARVLLAQGQLDQAEAELNQVTLEAFQGERQELLGDLYLQRSDPSKARAAYEAARAAGGASPLLPLKLDSLGGAGAAS
ncbi:MAG TPA: tetratricopeptide repeat protein [Candidatus Competibacteraceae bacterium]|nr:tetratricopeptide repeat protein [Candidatus Competibacteraceae bacterium]